MAVCSLKSIDLSNDTIKILGIHVPYNRKVQMQNNFITTIEKLQQALRLWNSRCGISNIKDCYLALITNVTKVIVKELQKIQKKFMAKLKY